MSGGAVELINVTKYYDRTLAVDGVSLSVAAGEYCCLLGPSGCGKTSTLRMIAGHELADRGDIVVGGRRVNDLPPSERGTAMMFQSYALFPHLTVLDNVGFAPMLRGVPKVERIEESRRLLSLVGLGGWESRYPRQLSGGQAQRAALARALNARPQVLLLDEPLSALDPILRIQMRSELKRMQLELGLTFIHVTHSQEEALALSDRVVVMEDGHIRQTGTPLDVFERPATPFVADFIGGHAIFRGTTGQPGNTVLPSGEILHTQTKFGTGTPVALAVRCDAISFARRSADDNSITARVVTIEHLGALIRVTLKTMDGQDFSVVIPERAERGTRLTVSEIISLYWTVADTRIYAEKQAQPKAA
ncbi:ABC transporter ATP-binding protein [Devosia riboflavina]|uniref:ABC transporter ATP-binding protein n=1 Tax=Devosia riboflavina TaxID=46914 RepID=UPI00068CB342|nr:ABC transporter ATP-binding protein [Devosia riboflavina]